MNVSVRFDTYLSGVSRVCYPKGNTYNAFCKYGDWQPDSNCSTMDKTRGPRLTVNWNSGERCAVRRHVVSCDY
jgi:hypothetical protein